VGKLASSEWLSQEWLDQVVDLAANHPEHPGASATMQWVLTGGPNGEVKVHVAVEDGRLAAAAVGPDPGAELTLTSTWDDARQIQAGELDLNAAFMQGRVKVAGNNAKLLAILPLTASEDYAGLAERVRRVTSYRAI
jgi:hypothetical protein